ncbi:MAG TPA: hypothetical protein VFQ53_13410 [Kofleriaceae bacterium]|nr:hypothetical protein [Kofleriaceae bacterium]
MRRFELGDKYFQGHVEGRTLHLRWGARDQPAKTLSRDFANGVEATAKLDQYLATKRAEGYVEVGAASTPSSSAPAASPAQVQWWGRFEHGTLFQELSVDGRTVRLVRGSIGKAPDVDSTAEQADVASARGYIERAVTVALDSGFRLVREGKVPATTHPPPALDDDDEPDHRLSVPGHASNAELEAQCRASPDVETPWAIYADWLIAQGDPRGELAALRLGGKLREAERYLVDHRKALFGSEVEHGRRQIKMRWRHGFVVGIELRKPDPEDGASLDETIANLLALPIARFVESLRFGLAGCDDANDWTDTITAVTRAAQAPYLRELRFDDYGRDDSEISDVAFGDFSHAWSQLPALETLEIRAGAGGTLGTLRLPKLRRLVRISGGLRKAELAEIVAAELPALEHLELWLGDPQYGANVTLEALSRVLAGLSWPVLRHLGLVNCSFTNQLVPALARSAIVTRLRSLDLSHGTLDDLGVEHLLANVAAFHHLESIDVSDNFLDAGALGRLCERLPNIRSTIQRGANHGERYVALGE